MPALPHGLQTHTSICVRPWRNRADIRQGSAKGENGARAGAMGQTGPPAPPGFHPLFHIASMSAVCEDARRFWNSRQRASRRAAGLVAAPLLPQPLRCSSHRALLPAPMTIAAACSVQTCVFVLCCARGHISILKCSQVQLRTRTHTPRANTQATYWHKSA